MDKSLQISPPTLMLMGSSDKTLWGMPIGEWQRRAFEKLDVKIDTAKPANLYVKAQWVFSTPLISALCTTPGSALIVDGEIAAVHFSCRVDHAKVKTAFDANDQEALKNLGLSLKSPDQLAGSYNETLRKRESPFAYNIERTSRAVIEQKLFDSSYKGITDFVTKYFWPWPAFHATRFCAALKITPNMVTGLSFIMVLAAFYFFMRGDWVLGMASAWFMTFLDTVDGKLARTTMQSSKWGHVFDHGIDLIHPPFWYWAWFMGLGANNTPTPDWLLPCLAAIFFGYWIDRIVEGLFILKFKFHIHMWKPIDSFVRIYTARRNPNTFIFMAALMLYPLNSAAGFIGYGAVTLWVWACIGFHVIRLIQAYYTRKSVVSWMIS